MCDRLKYKIQILFRTCGICSPGLTYRFLSIPNKNYMGFEGILRRNIDIFDSKSIIFLGLFWAFLVSFRIFLWFIFGLMNPISMIHFSFFYDLDDSFSCLESWLREAWFDLNKIKLSSLSLTIIKFICIWFLTKWNYQVHFYLIWFLIK